MFKKLRIGLLLLALAVTGISCDRKPAELQSQAVAVVNDSDITIHQLNNELERLADAGQENVTDPNDIIRMLVDRELLVQQAKSLRLDRTPEYIIDNHSSQDQILTQLYLERIMATVREPSAEEIDAYYDAHLQRFSERQQFSYVQIVIDLSSDSGDTQQNRRVMKAIEEANSLRVLVDWLDKQRVSYVKALLQKTGDQLDEEVHQALLKMNVAETARIDYEEQIVLLELLETAAAPVEKSSALPEIKQLILDSRRLEAANSEVDSLRERSTIDILSVVKNSNQIEAEK